MTRFAALCVALLAPVAILTSACGSTPAQGGSTESAVVGGNACCALFDAHLRGERGLYGELSTCLDMREDFCSANERQRACCERADAAHVGVEARLRDAAKAEGCIVP